MTSTVEFRSGISAFQAEIEKGAERALYEGAQVLKAAVVARETRVKTGGLRGSFVVGRVKHRGGRSSIDVYSPDPNAIWQEYGTLARRRKRLKQPARTNRGSRGGGGVAPLHYMRDGLRDAWPAMLELLARRMPGRA